MADVYRVGVAIGMTDNATQVLQALSRNVLGLNASALEVERSFGRLRTAALGLASILGADVLAKGLNTLATAGAKVLDQQVQMKNAGMTHLQIVQETAQAYRSMSEVRGPDVAQRLQAIRELRGIAGEGQNRSLDEVNQLLPDYLRAQTIVGAGQAHTLFRALELRGDVQFDRSGNLNNQVFHTGLDRALRALQASGGTVTPRDLYGVMQQSGPMARMMTSEAFYGMMTTAIMEMGGQRAGTALTAAGRALYGGIMPERNANEMLNLGLYDPHGVRATHGLTRAQRTELKDMGYSVGRGGSVMVDHNALAGQDVLNSQGLGAWINQYLAPALHNAFLRQHGSHPGLSEQQYDMQEMYHLFPTETFRRLAGFYLTQQENVERDQKLQNQSSGMGAYENNQDNYLTQLDNLKSSWASLMQTLGLPAARDGAHLLHELGMGIDYLTREAAAHPNAARDLIRLAGGLAAVTALSGTMAIAGVALGPLASGLRLMTGVLAGGEVASAASTAAILGGGAAVGGSLLGVAAGITALGVAVLALPPIMQWLATHFGVANDHPGINARGMALDHAPAQAPHPATANSGWWDSIRNAWNAPNASHGNARGYQSHSAQHVAHGNMGRDRDRPIQVTTQVVLDKRVLAEAMTEYSMRQAQQEMRASGTSPDVIQHPQVPGRAIGR